MKMLRNIRIATGVKRIEIESENLALFQIREILTEHRRSLIDRIIGDTSVYLNYKFSTPPKKEQVEKIKEKLYSLKQSNVDMSTYREIVDEILKTEFVHV